MKKYLAVAVISLFIGLAFAPSINANISKEALVEFTTEVCGLNGGKQTVKLTQQEVEEVEALFDSIRKRLNATESREEADEIFKEAVVELDKYGLLGGLSITQAQKLVTGEEYNSRKIRDLLPSKITDKVTNTLCLVNGNIYGYNMYPWSLPVLLIIAIEYFFGLTALPPGFLLGLALLSSYNDEIPLIVIPLFILFIIPFSLFLLFLMIEQIYIKNPLSLFNIIEIDNINETSNQWIRTNSMHGEKTIEGNMTGEIFGYTGLKIWGKDNIFHLLGFALWVNLLGD